MRDTRDACIVFIAMVSTDPQDDAWRSAAFQHVGLLLAGASVLSREAINTAFFLGGQRATLVDPQRGIHKPRVMRHLLSVTTVMPAKGRRIWYADQTSVHREIYAGEAGIHGERSGCAAKSLVAGGR
jgi:putative restriction endonuclease